MASARASVVRSYPRFELPRAFRDYEDFLRVADQVVAAAGVDDYTYIWWDVRPRPKLGTVEVRGMDVQPRPEANAAVAALIQALAAKEIDRPGAPGLTREAIEESRYQAGRYGLEARLMVDEAHGAGVLGARGISRLPTGHRGEPPLSRARGLGVILEVRAAAANRVIGEKVRAEGARLDQGHPDAVPAQPAGQVAGRGLQRRLGDAHDVVVGKDAGAAQIGERDDTAAAAGGHERTGPARQRDE